MHFKKTALTLMMATALSAGPVLAEKHTATDRWQGEAQDAWLDGKIETALLFNTSLNSFEINTDVQNSVAILSGTVGEEVEKELAGEIAMNIEGVSEVQNNIQVEEGHEGELSSRGRLIKRTMDDATVTAGLTLEFAANDQLNASTIDVDTDNGVVTLTGTVANAEAKALAEEMAESYDYVEAVQNELTVVE